MSWERDRRPCLRSGRIGIAALVVLTAGCRSMAPELVLPPAPVQAQFTGEERPREEGAVAAAELAWSEFFPDARLQQLIRSALENNRDLRAASLRVQEARAAWGIQSGEGWPTLAIGAANGRARVPSGLSLTGEPTLGGVHAVGLGMAQWELDFWGRVRSLDDAAQQTYLSAQEARRAASLSLLTQVAQGWLALCELDQRLLLARQALASREESLRIFTRRLEVGSGSRLELTQVRILAAQARALAVQLEQQRTQQVDALTLLVGEPLPQLRQSLADGGSAGGLDHVAVAQVAPGLPSALLTSRPDIVAAEHRLRAANARIGAARAAFFPRITLTSALGTASGELDGLFDAGSRAWLFAPTVSLPIFTGGRLRGNLDVSEIRRDIAIAEYERAIQSAFRDVADALAARQWYDQLLSIQDEAVAAETERARLARLRFDAGSAAFLEVLDAQRDLLAVQQQRVQTQRAVLAARIALYAALGGGSRVPGWPGAARLPVSSARP